MDGSRYLAKFGSKASATKYVHKFNGPILRTKPAPKIHKVARKKSFFDLF
jgi:hypothetical protein